METRAGRRWWRIGLLAAAIILALAAALFWATRETPGRDPLEFLPASAHAVVGCDMRPGSEGMRQALQEWGASDVRHLGTRGVELAQGVVDWLGFALEVRKDILPWFGGELLIASVTGPSDRARPLTPKSVVLILRTKSMRRARATLDRGVKPFAREANWGQTTEKHAGAKVTVWRDLSGRARLAYVVKDGCVLIAEGSEGIRSCLAAADDPARRLTYLESFQATVGYQRRETVAWGYVSVSSVVEAGRAVLPGLTKGWPGLLSRYRSYASFGDREGQASLGSLALSLSPAREGAEVRAVYRAANAARAAAKPSALARVAKFAPEEAMFSLAVHEPDDWLALIQPRNTEPQTARFFSPPGLKWLGLEQVPSDLMFTVLQADGKPSFALAAPAKQMPVPPRGMLSRVFPKEACTVVDGVALLAKDAQALKQCSRAAKTPQAASDLKGEVRLVISARPGDASSELAHVKQIRVVGRAAPGGGEGEITLAVPPRYLLGGR
jgi:hypothetical protein